MTLNGNIICLATSVNIPMRNKFRLKDSLLEKGHYYCILC